MIITRADLREWRIGAVMYRWFLRHFPRGGSYADIHHALIEEGYTDWAESLVEYAWKKWLADENFAHQESTGVVDSIILGPGGSAALAYHDGERVRFAVAIEGENNIRAGVRYRLNEQHQFVEC
ncbi:hypothetical protein QE659_05460 [Escherichia coli]|nr:hypothetical protein [Escherichia coli]